MKIFVLNSRIYSVEFSLLEMPKETLLAHGLVDGIGKDASIFSIVTDDKEKRDVLPILHHRAAAELILDALKKHGLVGDLKEIVAVGHRVVHGGERYTDSVLIDEEAKRQIYKNFELAPLHNPYNFRGMEAAESLLPNAKQIAVFDTSFHLSIPEYAHRYALPERFYREYRIRKYGFHGISHRYVAQRTSELLRKPLGKLSMISCHLGAGSSLCTIKDGCSIDTSMGFTPLEGLVMTTRCGDIDPGVIIYLLKTGMTLNDIETALNKESGTLGVSGISEDMKSVLDKAEKGDDRAKLALDIFVHRARKYLGAYLLMLEHIDAISFTGGIGMGSHLIRERIMCNSETFGIRLDFHKNLVTASMEGEVSHWRSRVKVFCIPRNEKLLIARDTYKIVTGGK